MRLSFTAAAFWLILLLATLSRAAKLLDNYNNKQKSADNYDYYDYNYINDEGLPISDLDYSSQEILFVPSILSRPVNLEVDSGMTITLPCLVDQLPDGVQIIWTKLDSRSTQIAIGKMLVAPEYMHRANVTVDSKGSTLEIGMSKSEDAGKYKCSVAVKGEQPELKHDVRIKVPPTVDLSTPSLLKVKKGDEDISTAAPRALLMTTGATALGTSSAFLALAGPCLLLLWIYIYINVPNHQKNAKNVEMM